MYGEENVSIDDYRYPGPKPNTKETAIVMLADTCESAVKSIVDPEPERVSNLISNLIDSRIEDGQLNETPITFSDIMKIKAAFIEALISQHHHRIRYPQQEAMERKDD
jgi:membrane-associated HD superfamily phosphohydrolase